MEARRSKSRRTFNATDVSPNPGNRVRREKNRLRWIRRTLSTDDERRQSAGNSVVRETAQRPAEQLRVESSGMLLDVLNYLAIVFPLLLALARARPRRFWQRNEDCVLILTKSVVRKTTRMSRTRNGTRFYEIKDGETEVRPTTTATRRDLVASLPALEPLLPTRFPEQELKALYVNRQKKFVLKMSLFFLYAFLLEQPKFEIRE